MCAGMCGRPEGANEEGRMLRNHTLTNEAERGPCFRPPHTTNRRSYLRSIPSQSLSGLDIFGPSRRQRYMKQASNTPRFSLYDI